MKNLKNLLVALGAGLLILTSACDKKEDVAPVTLLTKMTSVNPDGTNDERNYEYNSQNKLAKLKFIFDTTVYENQITYGADGKISHVLTLLNGVELYKYIYSWSANSVSSDNIQKNANNEWSEEGMSKSQYDLNSDGQITKFQYLYKQDTIWVGYYYMIYTWKNGNVEKSELWYNDNLKNTDIKPFIDMNLLNANIFGLKGANDTKSGTATFEYDTKNNAYLSLGFPYGVNGLTKNNVTKETNSFETENDQIYTYNYDYNDNNYPTKSTVSYTNQDEVTETQITLYEYTIK